LEEEQHDKSVAGFSVQTPTINNTINNMNQCTGIIIQVSLYRYHYTGVIIQVSSYRYHHSHHRNLSVIIITISS